MGFEKRAELTMKIWGVLMIGMIMSMLFTAEKLGIWSLGIPVLIVGAGITTTGFMWKWGEYTDTDPTIELEKSKRNRLSMALRDLSDKELASLRQRLATGDIDESQLERLLDDESELSKVKRR
jgi:hypothetical protein